MGYPTKNHNLFDEKYNFAVRIAYNLFNEKYNLFNEKYDLFNEIQRQNMVVYSTNNMTYSTKNITCSTKNITVFNDRYNLLNEQILGSMGSNAIKFRKFSPYRIALIAKNGNEMEEVTKTFWQNMVVFSSFFEFCFEMISWPGDCSIW